MDTKQNTAAGVVTGLQSVPEPDSFHGKTEKSPRRSRGPFVVEGYRKPCQYLGMFHSAGKWLMSVVMLIVFVSCMSGVLGGGSNSPSSYFGDLDAYERGD